MANQVQFAHGIESSYHKMLSLFPFFFVDPKK